MDKRIFGIGASILLLTIIFTPLSHGYNKKIDNCYGDNQKFNDQIFNINITIEGIGSVNVDPPGPYENQTIVNLTAVPNQGWKFNHWKGDLTGNNNPISILVDSNKSIIANFSQIKYSLDLNINGKGSVKIEPSGPYVLNQKVKLVANPNEFWKFSHWGGDIGGSKNPTYITMDGNKIINVYFIEVKELNIKFNKVKFIDFNEDDSKSTYRIDFTIENPTAYVYEGNAEIKFEALETNIDPFIWEESLILYSTDSVSLSHEIKIYSSDDELEDKELSFLYADYKITVNAPFFDSTFAVIIVTSNNEQAQGLGVLDYTEPDLDYEPTKAQIVRSIPNNLTEVDLQNKPYEGPMPGRLGWMFTMAWYGVELAALFADVGIEAFKKIVGGLACAYLLWDFINKTDSPDEDSTPSSNLAEALAVIACFDAFIDSITEHSFYKAMKALYDKMVEVKEWFITGPCTHPIKIECNVYHCKIGETITLTCRNKDQNYSVEEIHGDYKAYCPMAVNPHSPYELDCWLHKCVIKIKGNKHTQTFQTGLVESYCMSGGTIRKDFKFTGPGRPKTIFDFSIYNLFHFFILKYLGAIEQYIILK